MTRGRFGRFAGDLLPLKHFRGDGRGWLVLVLGVGWFLTLGMRFVVPALLPQIKADFGVGNTGAGFAVTLIWLTYAAMQLPSGILVDWTGERVLLAGSLVLGGLSLLLFAILPAFSLFLLAGALFGLGTGIYGTPRGTVLSRTFGEHDGPAFGVVLAMGFLGAATLPFVATLIAVEIDWRITFALAVPLFGILAAGVWWIVPDRERIRDDGVDWHRTVRAVLEAVSDRVVLLSVTGSMIMLFGLQGFTAFYATYLVEVKGLAPGVASALFGLLFVTGAILMPFAGQLADRYGHGRVLTVIAVLSAIPLALLPVVDGVLALAVVGCLVGLRLGTPPVVNAYIIGALPDDAEGTSWGLVRTVFFAVGSMGSVAVGVMADAALFDLAMYGLAGLTLFCALLFPFLPSRPDLVE